MRIYDWPDEIISPENAAGVVIPETIDAGKSKFVFFIIHLPVFKCFIQINVKRVLNK